MGEKEEKEEEIFPFFRPVLTNMKEFNAVIGPSGGERGYQLILGGLTAWGIAWYINGRYNWGSVVGQQGLH